VTIAHRLKTLRAAVARDLSENVLPFWMRRVLDEDSGFQGFVGEDGSADPFAPLGGVLAARLLWTFSAVSRYTRDEAHRMAADHFHGWLLERFWDAEHGGTYWMLDHTGQPLATRKQTYALAFTAYALAEYHLATGRQDALDQALTLFRTIEERAADRALGGYFEARSRDWGPLADVRLSEKDLNAPKSMNTHLHVMESYANLLRASGQAQVRERLRDLVLIHLERIVDPVSGHLRLFFDGRFEPVSGAVSYGHDIEASWLIVEAAERTGDAALLERARANAVRMAGLTLEHGFDHEHGGVFAERHEDGRLDAEKHWWMQAEAIVGFLDAFELSHDERFLAAAERTWAFVESFLIDREFGEWRWRVARDGSRIPGLPKVEPWKCPYHNSRAALEVMARVERLIAAAPPSAAPPGEDGR
jgi:cellobiose epimerase